MTVHGQATVKNEAGIHCRPSTHIIKTMQGYGGKIRVVQPQTGECDLTSMLDLMMLGLFCGTTVEIEVEGPGEKQVLGQVIELFETEYDFPNAGE